MEEVLHGRVIGQEEAVSAIARAIRRARVGLKNPDRPIASFIFAGVCVCVCVCVCDVGGMISFHLWLSLSPLLGVNSFGVGRVLLSPLTAHPPPSLPQVPPVWVSQSWPRPWPTTTLAVRRPWSGWTCPSSWRGIQSASSSDHRQVRGGKGWGASRMQREDYTVIDREITVNSSFPLEILTRSPLPAA